MQATRQTRVAGQAGPLGALAKHTEHTNRLAERLGFEIPRRLNHGSNKSREENCPGQKLQPNRRWPEAACRPASPLDAAHLNWQDKREVTWLGQSVPKTALAQYFDGHMLPTVAK